MTLKYPQSRNIYYFESSVKVRMDSKASDKPAVNLTISLGPDASSLSAGTPFYPSEALHKQSRASSVTFCTCFPYHRSPIPEHSSPIPEHSS